MFGTAYERLDAVFKALVIGERVPVDALTLKGHPEAIREFAICFDKPKSKSEIEFAGVYGIKWRNVPVFQDGKLNNDERDRIWVQIELRRAICVPVGKLDGFPFVEPNCPIDWRDKCAAALIRISPRAST